MKEKQMVIRGKSLKIPIFQGGMGVGISLGGLAGAVAKAGGVGMISAAQIGFREDIFEENPLKANLIAMEKEYKKAREISKEGVIGFNIMTALAHYKEYVEQACDLGADLIVSGAGLPVELAKYTRGTEIAIAPIVSTRKAAHTILHYWWKKERVVPDVLIVEGPEAGGHLGFFKQQLMDYLTDHNKYEREIEEILAEVLEWEGIAGRQIPVIVAGGIDRKEKVEQVMRLGAAGVQVGTRFVTTYECDADMEYKKQYLMAEKEDVVLIDSPVGMTGRALRNNWMKNYEAGKSKRVDKCYNCLKDCDRTNIPYCITEVLIAAAKGDMEHGLAFCGANVYTSKKLETVSEVIDSLMK